MKIFKIAATITSDYLNEWIQNLAANEFGGPEKANEGWCGEISGEIYRFLKVRGENPEIWGIIYWIDNKDHPNVIENLTLEEKECLEEQSCGVINHSFVKWNGELWDGMGRNTLSSMLQQHAWGSLGNGVSIAREV